MRIRNAVPFGVKLIVLFLVICLVFFVIGQGGAVLSYDTVAGLGLQETRQSVDPAIVEVNKGIALADAVVAIPLFLWGIIGLWRLRMSGAVASWLVLGINIYWPVVAWSKQFFYLQAGVKAAAFPASTHVVLAFVVMSSAWAAGYLLKNHNLFD